MTALDLDALRALAERARAECCDTDEQHDVDMILALIAEAEAARRYREALVLAVAELGDSAKCMACFGSVRPCTNEHCPDRRIRAALAASEARQEGE